MMWLRVALLLFLLYFSTLFNGASLKDRKNKRDSLVLTVATNQTDGFKRYMRSAKVYSIPVKVLGLGEKWEGGNVKKFRGGGQKINILLKELEKYKEQKDKIIMFTDSYDVIFIGGMDKIIEQFDKFNAKVVFSAEGFCWPDESLASKYPPIPKGKRYLNSGGFIGYAPELYKIMSSSPVENDDDDQLFYTKIYLDEELRQRYKIKLDHKSEIFQNLNGAVGDVELNFKGKEAYLQNTVYNTVPLVVHGNGPSKQILNTLGNYVGSNWNPTDGCVNCWDDMINLDKLDIEKYPVVVLGIFIEHPIPFVEEFLNKLANQQYPKQKIHIFIHNAAEYHKTHIEWFLEKYEKEYQSVKTINPEDNIKEWHARNLAIEHCLTKECDYYLSADGEAHLDNPDTLKLLIEQNRGIVAPLLIRPYKAWSNFWGALTTDGFYARSVDYMEIIKNERRGVWNVPYISACYLINSTLIKNAETRPSYIYNLMDADMAFCHNIREKDVFMYVSNRVDFGHLVNAENFETHHKSNELYQIFENRWDWEQRYIHENYSEGLNPNKTVAQPCPDVYWFPIVTPRFCREFIDEMENYGKWSDGTNSDPRLDGGYENVPTRDIHMKQVGLERQWMEFLRVYVRPLQEHVFVGYFHDDPRIEGGYESVPTRDIHMNQVELEQHWLYFLQEYVQPLQQRVYDGYESDPPRALMNFIVRYKPEEQPSLRPHHDSSTYTINVALNRPNIDYVGGGCRFIRYNCSVTDTRLGWMLMHPGRLTHLHEGLPVSNGTRYIMISFVDP